LLNTILGSFSTGAPPPSLTSYESIATVTVGGGGSSTITFSSIPATYTHLQIRLIAKTTTTGNGDDNFTFYFNSDTTYTNYRMHWLRGDGSTATAGNLQNPDYKIYTGTIPTSGAAQTSMFGAAVIDILDYANTNKYKTVRTLNGDSVNSTDGLVGLYSSLWTSTSAVTGFTFTIPAGTNYAQYTQIALYGIKGS
jgi:hypothetical protein